MFDFLFLLNILQILKTEKNIYSTDGALQLNNIFTFPLNIVFGSFEQVDIISSYIVFLKYLKISRFVWLLSNLIKIAFTSR